MPRITAATVFRMKASSARAFEQPPHAAPLECAGCVPGQPHGERQVQQRQRHVEQRVVRHRYPQHGREDDRRVAEHHREDEAQHQGVQRCVVSRTARRKPRRKYDRARQRQPGIAREQADGDEARQPLVLHRAPRDVLPQQPQRQRQQRGAEQLRLQRHAESQSRQHGDENALRRRRGRQEARQLEPFSGDGQHEEAGPPRHHFVDGKAGEPERIAEQPAAGAGGQREGEQGALAQEHRDGAGQQHGAAQREQQLCDGQRGAENQRQPAGAGGQRAEVGPALCQRHGALQADHRAEEAAHHERAVEGGEVGRRPRHGPAQPQQSGAHPDDEAGEAEDQQWDAPGRPDVCHAAFSPSW